MTWGRWNWLDMPSRVIEVLCRDGRLYLRCDDGSTWRAWRMLEWFIAIRSRVIL